MNINDKNTMSILILYYFNNIYLFIIFYSLNMGFIIDSCGKA